MRVTYALKRARIEVRKNIEEEEILADALDDNVVNVQKKIRQYILHYILQFMK